MVGRVALRATEAATPAPGYPLKPSLRNIYDAYPLHVRPHLTEGPPPLERALSQQRLPHDGSIAAQRMRELFDRPTPAATDGVSSPASRDYMRQRTERRSGNMCSQQGKFHGEVYETKERSRVINAIKRRSRTNTSGSNQLRGLAAASKFTADDVLRAGTLTKQGSWRRNWKTRFFLLRSDCPSLCYYKSEEKLELLGSIAITGDTIVQDKSPSGHAPYRFLLRTDDASLLLEAETQDNQQRWIDACMDLADAVRAERYRQSTLFADRDPTTAPPHKAVSRLRHSLATTSLTSTATTPSSSTPPARIRRSSPYDTDRQRTLNQSDLDNLLDQASSSDEEDNQRDDDETNQDDNDDDDLWATGRTNRSVVVDAMDDMGDSNQVDSSEHVDRQLPPGPRSHDLVLELVVGRQSRLLTRSESSNDKLSCCVKVVGYSSATRQSVELGVTDAVKLLSSAAQSHAADAVRVPFLIVLPADLARFDQLGFTVYRTNASSLSRTTIGLGRCLLHRAFLHRAAPIVVTLTEKSASFPDVISSRSSTSATTTTTTNSTAPGGTAVQLVVQAFPSVALHAVLPTSGVDMAAAKYLLPTTTEADAALVENGSFLTASSESVTAGLRRIVVDELLRTPRSTYALPLAFLDFLEQCAVQKTHALQSAIAAGDERPALLLELEFYRGKLQQYLRQRQFLLKQEQRLVAEGVDHTIFQHAALDSELSKTNSDLIAPFKRSTYKSLDLWELVPTNMQNQYLVASQPDSDALVVWHTMTMGCPAAHTKGFAGGGYPLTAAVSHADSSPFVPSPSPSDDTAHFRPPTSPTPAMEGSGGGGGLDALRSRLEQQDRLDVIASQTLSAAVACVVASLDLAAAGSQLHQLQLANAARFGFLIQFESLLSTQGKEIGMLEDFAAGARWLRSVFLQFRRSTSSNFFAVKSYSPPDTRSQSTSHLLVTVGVTDAQLQVLPPALAEGSPLRFRCVLFTQGVNEKQSLVHALKSQSVRLQEQINRANLAELKEIYAIFRRVHDADGVQRDRISRRHADRDGRNCISRYSLATLDELLAQIERHVTSGAAFKKNVALLMDTADFCRELGGARVTCCKSGKDRTAMAVTLEQARLCVAQLKVAHGHGKKLCATMRQLGVRRRNVLLNTLSSKFAFNEVQRKMLPECYKPPVGTYKSGKT